MEDGPAVSGGAGVGGGGTRGHKSEVLSTSTSRTGYSPLGRSSA